MIADRIILFLTSRYWQVVREDANIFELSPPGEFGLPNDYRVAIPKSTDKVDFKKYYDNLLQIFTDFYSLTSDDLNLILEKEDTILKVRIYDNSTEGGKIGFVRFEGIIERLKTILTDTASFVIDRNITSTRVPAEAYRYLSKCHFLQTERGSYVANIQLPSKELIKERELFDRNEVYAYDINNRLNVILNYVNTQILNTNETRIDDEYLLANDDKLNLKLLKDIEIFFDKSDLKNIDFSFHSLEESTIVESQNITKEKINRLSQFIEEVGNRTVETKEVIVRGVITGLKSKDPDGLKNNVTMTGVYEDLPIAATANLSSEHYKDAIEAHKIKDYVTIEGLARTTKTRIRFLRVDNFTVG